VIIQSVAFRTPSKRLSNEDILSLIRDQNQHIAPKQVAIYCETIQRLLTNTGAETRYVRDKRTGEAGFELLMDAVHSALRDADLSKNKIDLVIYCGVGRGFLEPANAIFVAKALGIACDAFDVNDACMSWVRSLHVAYNFLSTKTYSNVLVVNAEFTTYENGLPNVLRLHSDERIGYTFPALTIGEAATATVLTSSNCEWKFRFRADPSLAPLCTLPLPGYEDFCSPDERLGLNGTHQLVAFGMSLSRAALRKMVAFVRETYDSCEIIDVWFPHNTSEVLLQLVSQRLGVGPKLYTGIFRQYGNLVSASIPVAIATAAGEGRLRRGDRIVLCPATAGMAFGLVEGVY
jgi:3-oxoacyl-[acyl-carrier-protein] synthase III